MEAFKKKCLEDMENIIQQAERDEKWLSCAHVNMAFTPQELRKANAEGRFIWAHPDNLDYVDPKDELITITGRLAVMAKEVEEFLQRYKRWLDEVKDVKK